MHVRRGAGSGARRLRLGLLVAAVLGCAAAPSESRAGLRPCPGDCAGIGAVAPENVRHSIEIALGTAAVESCTAADRNRDGAVTVDELIATLRALANGCFGPPSLRASEPEHNAGDFPRTGWLLLDVADGTALDDIGGFALGCAGEERALVVTALQSRRIVVNPMGELPADSECALVLEGPDGAERLAFRTAGEGEPVVALYDREDPGLTSPYPDDILLVPDPETRTGLRHAMSAPVAGVDVEFVFNALLNEANELDGFSPIAHMVIELSDAVDPDTLPRTPRESLDPLATMALFALEEGRPARRVPFRLDVRNDVTSMGRRSRSLVLFPSVPLDSQGRYGLVLTRRALAHPRRPLAPSAAFARVLGEPEEGEAEVVARARALTREVLEPLAEIEVPILPWDVALATSIHVRSTDDIPRDMLAIREQILAEPPPGYVIDSVVLDAPPNDNAVIVRGRWQAPDFRQGPNLARDENGLPVRTGSRLVPFVLTLPLAAQFEKVPVVIHQHGNPGSMEEVVSNARRFLTAGGFAAIGFTDILNREVAPTGSNDARITNQVVNVLNNLLMNSRLPDHWVETRAEQVAFVRFVQSLGDLDVVPPALFADGRPDLDVDAPLLYHGISEGANNGQGLLPYAPEIRAAALVVGGARLTETLIHQQSAAFLNQLPLFFPTIAPAQIWSGFALFQAIFDVQDNHSHLPFLYRQPLDLGGDGRRASVLVLEGLGDTLVPNHATRSLAYSLGPVPHVLPVQQDTVVLEPLAAPLVANIDAVTTAGFYQYVPADFPGLDATPSCDAVAQTEGHYCPQVATESIAQRLHFLQSALGGEAPVIIDPLAEEEVESLRLPPPRADDLAG